MMLLGAAWQLGLVPLSKAALDQAIELNGQAVEHNMRAFEYGRWAVVHPDNAAKVIPEDITALPAGNTQIIDVRADHLRTYQSRRLAKRYRRRVEAIEDEGLQAAVAKGYHKVLAYKDEYEVARLLKRSRMLASQEFEGDLKLTYHLAPPLLSRQGPDGRPLKRKFGARAVRLLGWMAWFKFLRGTPFDPFGYFEDRRLERQLIAEYERDLAELPQNALADQRDAVIALAELPLTIRGFGPVKRGNYDNARKRREELWARIRSPITVADTAAE